MRSFSIDVSIEPTKLLVFSSCPASHSATMLDTWSRPESIIRIAAVSESGTGTLYLPMSSYMSCTSLPRSENSGWRALVVMRNLEKATKSSTLSGVLVSVSFAFESSASSFCVCSLARRGRVRKMSSRQRRGEGMKRSLTRELLAAKMPTSAASGMFLIMSSCSMNLSISCCHSSSVASA